MSDLKLLTQLVSRLICIAVLLLMLTKVTYNFKSYQLFKFTLAVVNVQWFYELRTYYSLSLRTVSPCQQQSSL